MIFFVNKIPFLNNNVYGITIFPFIFIKKSIKKNPTFLRFLILHEKTHLCQQVRYFVLPFHILYLLSKNFRLKMELEAFEHDVIYYNLEGMSKQQTVRILVNRLTSKVYRNMITTQEAYIVVTKLVDDLWINK